MEPELQAEAAALQGRREKWAIPGAILAAGILLAIATFIIRTNEVELPPDGDVSLVRPVSEADHLIGNPAAPVIVIEYADLDSNYTKDFQATMQQLMAEYATGGKVAWAFRHLPLIDQHPNSRTHAEASECVASLGGEPLFWRFIDAMHAQAPGSQQLSPASYDGIVERLGLSPEAFNLCLNGNDHANRVMDDFENGLNAGAGGSPFSVVLVKGHPPVSIDGAVPYEGMKRIIEEAIARSQ